MITKFLDIFAASANLHRIKSLSIQSDFEEPDKAHSRLFELVTGPC